MITLSGWLVSVVPDMRIAQIMVENRGVLKVPLTRDQVTELAPLVEKRFRITVEEEAEAKS